MFGIAENIELLKDIGIADAPEEVKQPLIAEIEDFARKKLAIKLSERITPQQAEELAGIAEEQKVHEWLSSNLPDCDSIVSDIIDEVKNEIKNDGGQKWKE